MEFLKKYTREIFNIKSENEFEDLALQAFYFQYDNNIVYREFCELLKIDKTKVKRIYQIPFLPVNAFKNCRVVSGNYKEQKVFKSSTTTSDFPSLHYVADLKLYESSLKNNFVHFYGDIKKYSFLALLPSYLEREDSSLVYMVEKLIEESESSFSGFYLYNYNELIDNIKELEKLNKNYVLFGVSFALLDLASNYSVNINNGIIIETGGMKGRRKEITREELHNAIKKAFNINSVHSEYGMTELLSQAYSYSSGIYYCPPQMKVLVRDITDPLSTKEAGKGALNIIDLANIFSCSFIATADIGEVFPDKSFSVYGRFDEAEVRGCNLMVL